MKYYGTISDPKDMVTKEYVDNHSGGGSATAMTEQEIVAAVDGAWTVYPITVSGATAYDENGYGAISGAMWGDTVKVQAVLNILSIESIPAVSFTQETAVSYEFTMPKEAITITVTTSGGGGNN